MKPRTILIAAGCGTALMSVAVASGILIAQHIERWQGQIQRAHQMEAQNQRELAEFCRDKDFAKRWREEGKTCP